MNPVSTKKIRIGSSVNQEISIPIISVGKGQRTVGIITGMHGNEPEGLFIFRNLLNELKKAKLNATVKLLAGANPFALIHSTRQGAFDAADLNRSFPGDPSGNLTQRLAHAITKEFSNCDTVIDLHSVVNHGGYMGLELEKSGPLLERTKNMNRLLKPDAIWQAIEGSKFNSTLVYVLLQKGVSATVIEVPRLEYLTESVMNRVVNGLLHIAQLEPGKKVPSLKKPIPFFASEQRYLADGGGIYNPIAQPMTIVKKGQPIGVMTDLVTLTDMVLRSRWGGILTVQSSRKTVTTGDKIYVVGKKIGDFR